MFYDVINYNDITFTSCSHEQAKKVRFTDVQTIKILSNTLRLKNIWPPLIFA